MSSQSNESSMPAETSRPQFEVGQQVQTPSGSVAELIAIYPLVNEGLVQWSTGDRTRFKLGLLRRVPDRR
jgi:hypothetical protein